MHFLLTALAAVVVVSLSPSSLACVAEFKRCDPSLATAAGSATGACCGPYSCFRKNAYYAQCRLACKDDLDWECNGVLDAGTGSGADEDAESDAPSSPSPAPAPPVTPFPPPTPPIASPSINLLPWKLQTTIPDDDGSGVEEIWQPLLESYSSPEFFREGDMGYVMSASVNGATTSGTQYARTELREVVPGAGRRNAAWDPWDGQEHVLRARISVNALPAPKPQVILGQVHGTRGCSPAVKLRYYGDTGLLRLRVKTDLSNCREESQFDLGTFMYGDTFEYSIAVRQGQVSVSVNNGTTFGATRELIFSLWRARASDSKLMRARLLSFLQWL